MWKAYQNTKVEAMSNGQYFNVELWVNNVLTYVKL